eukprot:scaffold1824_cov332-Prasinococcus_capsulatus_cf.AAC.10
MLLREERYQVESLEEELQALTAVASLKDQVAETISQQLSEQEARNAELEEDTQRLVQENEGLRKQVDALHALTEGLSNDVSAHRTTAVGTLILEQAQSIQALREQMKANEESERLAWGKATAELEAVTHDCRCAWTGRLCISALIEEHCASRAEFHSPTLYCFPCAEAATAWAEVETYQQQLELVGERLLSVERDKAELTEAIYEHREETARLIWSTDFAWIRRGYEDLQRCRRYYKGREGGLRKHLDSVLKEKVHDIPSPLTSTLRADLVPMAGGRVVLDAQRLRRIARSSKSRPCQTQSRTKYARRMLDTCTERKSMKRRSSGCGR